RSRTSRSRDARGNSALYLRPSRRRRRADHHHPAPQFFLVPHSARPCAGDVPLRGGDMTADLIRVPLHRLAHGRAGDKGDTLNVSVIAYRPEDFRLLLDQVTEERVA